MVWACGKDGRAFGVKITRSDERCKAKRKTSKRMAGQCEESVRSRRMSVEQGRVIARDRNE